MFPPTRPCVSFYIYQQIGRCLAIDPGHLTKGALQLGRYVSHKCTQRFTNKYIRLAYAQIRVVRPDLDYLSKFGKLPPMSLKEGYETWLPEK